MADEVQVDHGRRICFESAGDPGGRTVILLHGTPGSRLGPRPRAAVLHRLGINLITFDRPGYGGSDRRVGRRVADVASDVCAIADACRLDKFAVIGRSGGGPHALACAALRPERVTRAAVLVGLAPQAVAGLDWFDGMTASNVIDFTAAAAGHDPLAARLVAAADAIRADPAGLIARLYAELTDSDRRVIADPGIRSLLARSHAEALRNSADGWIDDVLAFCSPWGFDPGTVTTPALLWHGERDVFSPVSHARWLASQIRGATIMLQEDAAHFSALDVLPDVLRWLVADQEAKRSRGLGL